MSTNRPPQEQRLVDILHQVSKSDPPSYLQALSQFLGEVFVQHSATDQTEERTRVAEELQYCLNEDGIGEEFLGALIHFL